MTALWHQRCSLSAKCAALLWWAFDALCDLWAAPQAALCCSCTCRELFRLPEDVDISLTFGCKEPMSGTHLKLEGMGAFDAAVHCASVAAAERQQKIKKSYSTGNLGAVPTLADGTGRSASINNIPGGSPRSGDSPSDSSALSPATPPPAAGASAAGAAQDRRQRFPAQPNHRSRSFSAFSGSGPRSTGVEQPAAFRNILGMLNGNSAQAPAGEPGAAGAPQASPRSGLPPAGAVRFAEPPAAVTAQPSRSRSRGLSLRNISQTQLKDVPEVDETVAVGSLSGKFKLSFKAFSRKVARGLSFTSKDSKSSAAAGSSGPSFSATSMEQLPALSAGNRDSFSITSNSSSRVESFSAPTAAAGVAMPGRAASPLPPATPPSIYSC